MTKRLVPTDLAALALGVKEATVRKMASRGTLTRYGTKQRARYDLDELLDVLERRDAPATCPA
ncbi:helix-turn-helix domain-containing protein [Plantactinospora solaniradicis]|uniref:Helix-turn-helix domain-containing protein n=1 Tax=Plantactinospora solaniradicis TaxID=1723736 RepID=A0ABW1K7J1_9ACTN